MPLLHILAGLLFFALPTFAEEPPPLKIGILVPLTGEISSWGTKALEGMKLAFKDAPSDRVRLYIEDGGSLASRELLGAARKLFNVDKVDILIGPASIDQTALIAPLSDKLRIPTFALSLCSSELSKYSHVYCSYPSSKEQLSPLPSLLEKLKVKKISLVLEQSLFANEVLDIIKDLRTSSGFEILSTTTLASKDQDLRSIIAKIRNENPDAVFACTVDPAQSFAFFKQLKEQGFQGARIGYLDIDEKYRKEFGKSIEGIFLPGFISNRYSKSFTDAYSKEYSRAPDMYGAIGFDIGNSVLEILKANYWRLNDLTTRMETTPPKFPAISGFRYRGDRTVSLPIEVWRVEPTGFLPYDF